MLMLNATDHYRQWHLKLVAEEMSSATTATIKSDQNSIGAAQEIEAAASKQIA
jgi:hypothetical protein